MHENFVHSTQINVATLPPTTAGGWGNELNLIPKDQMVDLGMDNEMNTYWVKQIGLFKGINNEPGQ